MNSCEADKMKICVISKQYWMKQEVMFGTNCMN